MELVAKRRRGSQVGISACSGIHREYGGAGKAEDVIVLEIAIHLDDFFAFFDGTTHNAAVHITKLTAVAFIKDQNDVLVPDGVLGVLGDEHIQLLNGGDNDFGCGIFQLTLQDCRALVSIGGAFFKAVVFLDGLVVQIFPVYHKQHLVNIRQSGGQLGGIEGGQGFAAAGGVPDVAAGLQRAHLFVVGGHLDAV